MEQSLEGETTWMSVDLIGYSKGWLCDCQHLREGEGSVIMGKSLNLLLQFSSPIPVSPLLSCFQSSSPSLPFSLRHVDFYES